MKKIINFHILFLAFPLFCIGQNITPEFITTFYITDEKNNKDSIKIGYDPTAQYGVTDGDFGEEIINSIPFNSTMDFRVEEIFAQSKKFIEKRECDTNKKKPRIRGTLLFYSKNYPLAITWDTTALKNKCVENTMFHRGSLSEVLQGYNKDDIIYLKKEKSKYIITKSYLRSKTYTNTKFTKDIVLSPTDTVYSLMIFMNDWKTTTPVTVSIVTTDLEKDNVIKVFPNPVENDLFISSEGKNSVKEIFIYNITGEEIYNKDYVLRQNNDFTITIDVSNYEKGIYFLKIEYEDNRTIVKKFVKNL